MKWFLLILLLTIPIAGQAPSDDLERAMKSLRAEIEITRAEVNALKAQQEQEAKAKQLRQIEVRRKAQLTARRAARRVVVREARRQKPSPKEPLTTHIKKHEEQIKQSELILAQLDSGTVAPSQVPDPHQKVILDLLNQRNALQEKIRRQNNRRLCRWFRIGCIGRK